MYKTNKKPLLSFITIIFIWVATYISFIKPFNEETENIKENTVKMRTTINASLIHGDSLLDEINLKKILEEQGFLEKKIAGIKNKILFIPNSAYSAKIPEEDMSIKFNSFLTAKYLQIQKSAALKGIKIPLTLGFRNDAIPHDLLPVYFERLDIIEQMSIFAIEKGCKEIISVEMDNNIGGFLDQNSLTGKYIKKDAIVMRLKVNFKTAVEIVYSLISENIDSKRRFIAIPRISMQSENIDLDLLTMTLAVGSVKEIDKIKE
jgi:hypothetical protein